MVIFPRTWSLPLCRAGVGQLQLAQVSFLCSLFVADHPRMCVLSKIIFGELTIDSYDRLDYRYIPASRRFSRYLGNLTETELIPAFPIASIDTI